MKKPITMPMRPPQPKPPQAFLFTDLVKVEEMLTAERMYCPYCGVQIEIFPPIEGSQHELDAHPDKISEQAEFMARFMRDPNLPKEHYGNIRQKFAGSILQARPDLRQRALLAGWIRMVDAPRPGGVVA